MSQTKLGYFTGWPYDPNKIVGSFDYQLEQNEFDGFYSQKNPNAHGRWLRGGEFLTRKHVTTYTPSEPAAITWSDTDKVMYRGSLIGYAPSAPPFTVPIDLSGLGPEMLRIADPTQALYGGLNALYELRELPDLIEQDILRLDSLRALGNLDLAVSFGVLPFYNDVKNFFEAQGKMEKRLDQLFRDAGRPVRRKFEVKHLGVNEEDVLQSGTMDYPSVLPIFVAQAYAGPGTWSLKRVAKEKVWFSGQARYDLPTHVGMDTTHLRRQLRYALYGLRLTPKVIWNAVPWSWMVDWVTNTGDIISNLLPGVAERLVWDYAFIMRTIEHAYVMEQTFPMHTLEGVQTFTVSTKVAAVRKERCFAYPFTWALKEPALDPYQLNILGALGLSRRR